MRRFRHLLLTIGFALLLSPAPAQSPGISSNGGLPPGSVLRPKAETQPAQRLHAELQGGRQSFLVALGNTLFSSPLVFGGPARAAGLTCNACHINGDANPAFFVPGISSRPGNVDATGPLFNPRVDNHLADPVDIPSLRGVRHLGPYGRDGRIASLREFVGHVIVDEFQGDEPTPLMLDALVAYLNEQEFLANPKLDARGRLRPDAGAAARRGERLFRKPFAAMDGRACASCHQPETNFTDGRVHDVGSGGGYKTPTLRNANTTAPYFHDGRYAGYAEVVAHFDRSFGLGLGAAARADLVAYLNAVGDGEDMVEPVSFRGEMSELATWVGVLDRAIAEQDRAIVRLVVDTVIIDMRRVRAWFPEGEPATHQSIRPDRRKAPVDYPRLEAALEQVASEAEAGRYAAAARALDAYHDLVESMVANYPRPRQAAMGSKPN